MYKALTIAGSDSGGGAGIQTDLKTFAALGVYGTSVITALTAQNTKGVHGIHPVPPDFINCQLEAVLSDIPVHAAKTGMLGDAKTITAVADSLNKHRVSNLVVDPVMVAQSGDRLLQEDAVDALRDKLLPHALVVTPNLPEAEVLLGRQITTVDAMVAAAREIRLMGPRHVLVKGGHLEGQDMVDIFFDGRTIHHLSEKKLDTPHTHGTGCTYAAAIAACLAKNLSPYDAVTRAKQFITDAISHGICVGGGYGPTNPMGALLRELELSRASQALYKALAALQKTPACANILADGRSNIFYSLEGANSLEDIASFPTPLYRCHNTIAQAGDPVFAGGLYPEEMLLQAHQKDARIRGMINLRYTPEMALAASALNYKTVKLSGDFAKLSEIPEVLVIEPTEEQEGQIILFARTPQEAAQKTAGLARSFSGC
ncbi:bifunctional hydroxymethylpyrimidine kinase/phosphomethylpyrimidine kinase [Dethiobacter alkaliphilus]|uniref:Hydroxymethylpyrimidine/phosphomethylpyrimidine kinase n=1 Tax=Dethiobacter alkaliphilus AHT 1 TaxID=555088 RepID=C0GKN8_DETAL|nr:bifunctional hydroxymethylpyrimidine kinase/phosphomethylpyrimidine kinase [Dethiobacter alkaliphilus]EEG76130.1 phosphomethylpyrimidine kinase [Dethiobacter alkaliphilus AHT 1]